MAYTAGNVKVNVSGNLNGLQRDIAKVTNKMREITINVDGDMGAFERKVKQHTRNRNMTVNVKIGKAAAELALLSKLLDGATRKANRLALGITAAAAATVALGAGVNAVSGLSVALAQAAGAALLLPGALGAGIAVAGALMLAFRGFGDALSAIADGDAKKLDEALKGMAPSAQEFLRTVWDLRGAFSELKNSVQGAAFDGLASTFRDMARATLPILKDGLTGIAEEFNLIAKRMMMFFQQAGIMDDMRSQFESTRAVVRNLGEALTPLMRVFSDLATVGLGVLAELTGGAGAAAQEFAVLVHRMRETGELREIMLGGLDALKQIWDVVSNLGVALFNVLKIADETGGGTMSVLVGVTEQIRAFTESSAGVEIISTVFNTLRDVIDAVRPGVEALLGALGQVIKDIGPQLPAVGEAFSAIAVALAPVIEWLGRLVAQILPPLSQFIKDNPVLLLAIAAGFIAITGAIRGFIALSTGIKAIEGAVNAFRMSTLLSAAATRIASAATVTWTAVTRGAAIAMWALNAAFRANPIGFIVTALIALVAGLVWAYNNVEWFRDGVDAAFRWIKDVAKSVGDFFVSLWTDYVVPAWQGIVGAITVAVEAISAAATWLWESVLKPVFDAISLAVRVLIAVLFTVFVAPMILAFNLISAAATWLWNAALKPTFDAIAAGWAWLMGGLRAVYDLYFVPMVNALAAAARWLWENALKPTFDAIAAGWQWLINGVVWVWANVLKPAWDALAGAATWLWEATLRVVFAAIGAAWNGLLTGMRWVWENVLRPTWDALVAAANWLWNNALKPVFDGIGAGWRALMNGIRWVYDNVLKPTFDAIVGALGMVKGAFSSAVDWIGSVWNKIRGLLAKPVNFMINTVYNDGIRKAWGMVAGWLKLPQLPMAAPIQEFAVGGSVRDIERGGRVGGAGNTDKVPAMLMPGEYVLSKKVVKQWGLGNIDNAHRAARGGANVGPEGMMQRFAAGGRVEEAKKFARSQSGKPYQWGGTGNPSYDCSGFMSAIHNVLVGKSPNSRRWTTHAFEGNRTTDGYVRGLSSAFTIGVQRGHMGGTLDGMNVESSGGRGVQAGGSARGSTSFPWKFSLPQVGGQFVDGGAGGGGGSFFSDFLKGIINGIVDPIRGGIDGGISALIPGAKEAGTWASAARGTALKVVDEPRNWLFRKIDEMFGASDGGGNVAPGTGPVQDQVRSVANTYGWGTGPQWDALVRLVQKESSWNPNAANPTSSARGLFQQMESIHGKVSGNPAQQAAWGLNYIKQRYGNPMSALAFHNGHGWYEKGGPVVKPRLYDNGGILNPTPGGYGMYANWSGKPEAVLTNDQMTWLRGAADNGAAGGAVYVTNNIPVREDASPEAIAQSVTRLSKRAMRGVK